jgi:hypothetical protein
LKIDVSPRGEHSISRRLGSHIAAERQSNHAGGEAVAHDPSAVPKFLTSIGAVYFSYEGARASIEERDSRRQTVATVCDFNLQIRRSRAAAKTKEPRHTGSGSFWFDIVCGESYAKSGILLTFCSCGGMCFFNQTFALHRPMNGATAIIPNATPNAICMKHLLSP